MSIYTSASDSCLMKIKTASTASPQIHYYILQCVSFILNGCSTMNSTTVRLLGLLV